MARLVAPLSAPHRWLMAVNFVEDADRELVETTSGSKFDPLSHVASVGGLKGTRLEKLGGIISYRRAWLTFYPQSELAVPKWALPKWT